MSILEDDYPFTKYDETGDFSCETCEKKFFAPGYCDSCFLDLIKPNIVEAEREQCCKDICQYCRKGIEVYELDKGGRWFHKTSDGIRQNDSCWANGIRQRVSKESTR